MNECECIVEVVELVEVVFDGVGYGVKYSERSDYCCAW